MAAQAGISGDLAALEVGSLRKAIEEFNKEAAEQTARMVRLTRILIWLTSTMTFLTAAMVMLIVSQVLLSLLFNR